MVAVWSKELTDVRTCPPLVVFPEPYYFFGKGNTVVTAAARPSLQPGTVYRTDDLRAWGANTPRLAKRLVREGALEKLAQGLFVAPKRSQFGVVPPTDEALMRGFLKDGPFVFTGPERWNALGLGSTAVHALALVYNTKRSGVITLGGRKFNLRRVAFPRDPSPEWFAVDLLENRDQAGVGLEVLEQRLVEALRKRTLNGERLVAMANEYGTRETYRLCRDAVERAAA